MTYLFAARTESVPAQHVEQAPTVEADPAIKPAPVPSGESRVRFVALDEPGSEARSEPRGWADAAESSSEAEDRVAARAQKKADRVSQRASRAEGEFEPINNVSLHALGRRGISAEEMNDFLLRRGFDADAVSAECERLLGVGLLDDAVLAESLVRSLRGRKGLGRGAVSAELKRRKIDPLIIEEVLSEIDSDDDGERALEIAVKRAPQLRGLDHATAQRRLTAFLMRKGYSGSAVSSAVSAALSGGRSPSGGPVFR